MDLLGLLANTALQGDSTSKKRKFQTYDDVHFPDTKRDSPSVNGRFLSRLVRKWCYFEHFYSNIDKKYFADNEFLNCLLEIGSNHVTFAKKETWCEIRRKIGKTIGQPRRLSNHFLRAEREKLEAYRQTVRLSQTSGRSFEEFLYQQKPLKVGDRVTLYIPKSQEFQQGVILSIVRSPNLAESSHYLVQFDESGDEENAPPPTTFTDIYLAKKEDVESVKPNMSPKITSIPHQVDEGIHLKTGFTGVSPLSPTAIQELLMSNILTQKKLDDESNIPFLGKAGRRESGQNHIFSRFSQEDSMPLQGVFSQRSIHSTFSLAQYEDEDAKVSVSHQGFSQSSWLDHTTAFEASRWSTTVGAGPVAASFLQTVASSRPPAGARSVAAPVSEDILEKVWRESERESCRMFDECEAKLSRAASVGNVDFGDVESNSTTSSNSSRGCVSRNKALLFMKENDQLRSLIAKCLAGLMTVGHDEAAHYHKDPKLKFWIDKLVDCDEEEKVMLTSAYVDATNALKLIW